jgi:anti-anti-sigma factor
MPIESSTEDTIVVDLPPEQEMRTELESLMEMVSFKGHCDVVIDFSKVDIVNSPSFCRLLKLRTLLVDRGHRLVLCSLAANTKGIFAVTGLDRVFEFADDKSDALTRVQPLHGTD